MSTVPLDRGWMLMGVNEIVGNETLGLSPGGGANGVKENLILDRADGEEEDKKEPAMSSFWRW